MGDIPTPAHGTDDDALLGPGSTATGGGTSQDARDDDREDEPRMPPLDPSGNAPTQLADERTQHEDL